MKLTASDVLAVSTECCSSSWRDCKAAKSEKANQNVTEQQNQSCIKVNFIIFFNHELSSLPLRFEHGSPAYSGQAFDQTCWEPLCAKSRTSSWPWTGPVVSQASTHTHSKNRTLWRKSTPHFEDVTDCHYLSIVNDHWSKLFPGLCVVKGSTSFANLDKQGLPLGEVFAQPIVDVLSLHVPQALVLQPHLEAGNKD